MSRKKRAVARVILPDPRFDNLVVAKFINRMMLDGKKSISRSIVYKALEIAEKKSGEKPLDLFLKAMENVKPMLEVKSKRVGGSTYQVPIEVREGRREALAMRWIIQAARNKSGRAMHVALSEELLDAFRSAGVAFKKKEDSHRMAEANKAFSHFR